VWNYPVARILLGAGGAYFTGALIAVLSIMLVQRNAAVSPWFPLLLLYPVWEVLFSGYRQRVLRGRPVFAPDQASMHTLFYKRVRRQSDDGLAGTGRNSAGTVTSLLLFAAGAMLPATLWRQQGPYLVAAVAAYVVIYLSIYRRLVRFGASPADRRRRTPAKLKRAP
jgi:UDP-N-acetylmuramyl pentapeptide phosphotransferase/UDP-N-acetylglucosamine-1-phosphate transferase